MSMPFYTINQLFNPDIRGRSRHAGSDILSFSKRYLLLILILLTLGNSSKAYAPTGGPQFDDNKRYLALMLLNENQEGPDDMHVADIQAAYDKGFNSVYLSVPWQLIKCRNRACRVGRLPGATSMNPNWNPASRYWTFLDNQIAKAKQLGMKIAFRINLSSQDIGYGVSKYLWGENNFAERMPGFPGDQGPTDLGYYDSRQFSFSSQAAIDSAKLFIGEVMTRYGYLEAENNLLFVAVTTSPTQEMEYDANMLDYSPTALSEYNVWYQSKYGTNYPSVPLEFTSTEGKKWYTFRHKKLKDFVGQVMTKVKSYNSNIKFISEYGCAFDDLSSRRGTLGFKNLGQYTDGIKVNDGFGFDHRFSMDMTRSAFPGKWIMNEYLVGSGSYSSSELSEFIDQSFAHGAKLFSVITDIGFLNQYSSVYTTAASQWLTGTMGTVSTNGSISYTFAEALIANYGGSNKPATSTRNIYQEWLNIYNSNPSNAKPVTINYDDSELADCTPPSAPTLSASPTSIASGASSSLSASGCSGGTITWSDGLGTGSPKSVSPTATKTYTATCTVSGCTSASASVTVTVVPPACDFNITAGNSNGNPSGGASVNLTYACTGANCASGVTYAWSGNGISGSGTPKAITAPSTAGTYTYTVTASKSGCTNKTANTSITVGSGNPCGFTEKGNVGTWYGLNVQTRQYTVNGTVKWMMVTAPTGTSNDKHFVRGANFAENSGVSWTGSAPAKSCFGGGDTGWGGLELPSGVTVPPGYTQGTEPDGAIYFAQSCTPPSAPSLSASPTTVAPGGSSTLTASGCSGGTITWSDGLGTGTSKTVNPTSTKTYTATCSIGGCTSGNGSVTVSTCSAPSAPSLSASPSSITSGASSTLTASGCSGGTITWSHSLGTGTSKTVSPTSTTTYTATCSISGCTSGNGSTTVTVTPPSGINCNTLASDVNGISCGFTEGWIYDQSNPNTPVLINIYEGSTLLISNYSANMYRQDLFNAGFGNGQHAWEIPTPSSLKDGQSHTITFKAAACPSYELNSSPRIISGCSNLMLDPGVDAAIESRYKGLVVAPNPSNGNFETRFYLEKNKKATITVSDLQGRVVYKKLITGQGNHKERITLTDKSSGMMLLQLHSDKGVEVKKLNIVR